MELKSLVGKLHPLERKVLPVLAGERSFSRIVERSGLQEIEVMRALQWLENKKVLRIDSVKRQFVFLDKKGQGCAKEGMPERKLLSALGSKWISLGDLMKKTNLEGGELNAVIGVLKRKAAIDLKKEKELMIKLGSQGEKLLEKGMPEEGFLKKKFPLPFDSIQELDKLALDNLLKRKGFLKVEEVKDISVELSELGKKLVVVNLGGEGIGRLTPGILKMRSWKGKKFRAYDVEINVPKIYRGKKHFVNEALEYAKQLWIEMGFKEMTGGMVGTSFWCFDALFQPQDHPARDLQDTFFLAGEAEKGRLPAGKIVQKVKAMHERGGDLDSTGWQYTWSEEEAKRNVLRTHTTMLSAQALAGLKEKDLPQKFFALGKCFRNEAVDWSHLFEFNQTEGIVADKQANFRNLLGYLKQFFAKMGFPKARFRPAYFPYTEPSVEIDVYHPVHKKWMELGGAGMFRPEVVVPLLGFECPVLAWGPGFDRIILDYYGINDIRELYKNNLKKSREIKAWLK